MRYAAFVPSVLVLVVSLGCAKTNSATQSEPAPVAAADKERLQGVWAIESWESGDPRDKIPEEERKGMRLVFEGDSMRLCPPDGFQSKATFVLDPGSNPKALTMTPLNRNGEPRPERKMEWIYKLDGESLVLAITMEGSHRPTEFQAKAGVGRRAVTVSKGPVGGEAYVPPVDVVRLKKTNESPPAERKSAPVPIGTRK